MDLFEIKGLIDPTQEAVILTVPSGYTVTIRQQTGEDDDIISKPSSSFPGAPLNDFVKNIIINNGLTDKPPTLEEILQMKLCDKYFIIIASRIFSLGHLMKFEYEWPDGIVAPYEEDLRAFIWNYDNNDFPQKGDIGYSPYRIPPHEYGMDIEKEFTISTGKVFKFTFMNGVGEKYLMTLPEDSLNKNTELKARSLKQKIGENWVTVQGFKNYGSREMVEIRKNIFSIDPVINLLTFIPHPVTGEKVPYSLLGSSDFLFPREV